MAVLANKLTRLAHRLLVRSSSKLLLKNFKSSYSKQEAARVFLFRLLENSTSCLTKSTNNLKQKML